MQSCKHIFLNRYVCVVSRIFVNMSLFIYSYLGPKYSWNRLMTSLIFYIVFQRGYSHWKSTIWISIWSSLFFHAWCVYEKWKRNCRVSTWKIPGTCSICDCNFWSSFDKCTKYYLFHLLIFLGFDLWWQFWFDL